jgi:hypothetical protein
MALRIFLLPSAITATFFEANLLLIAVWVEENICPPAADCKKLPLAIRAERRLFYTSAVPASVTRQP